jgi:hypothetical protein
MAQGNTLLKAASRLARAGRLLLRALLVASLVSCCGHSAWAKQKPKKKKTAHAKISKKPVSLDRPQLRTADYPPEISGQIAAYNSLVKQINAERKKDPKLAKARGEVLEIQKESFDLYASFMAEMNGREVDKIRKAVAVKGWYKGMPQIAFVVSMGLPDDLESMPAKDGGQLKLIYKTSSFYFEKGRLREYEAGK